MASVDIACDVDEWHRRTEVFKILSCNNNACKTNLNCDRQQKCGINTCACVHKENVKEDRDTTRKRSKSESCKSVITCGKSNQFFHDSGNRIRTYSGNRSMHDKGMDVYMMPENMSELLLDGYKKENLKWPHDVSGDDLNGKSAFVDSVPNGYKNGYDCDSCHRERVGGIKRTRDESPSLINGEESSESKDGIPFKMQLRNIEINEKNSGSESCHNGFHIDESITSNTSVQINAHTVGRLETPIPVESTSVTNCDVSSKTENERLDKDGIIDEDLHLREEMHNCASDSSEVNEDICQCMQETEGLSRHNKETLHSGLRLSLFPLVPPYIQFSPHDMKGEPFPAHVHKLLRWKLSTITPLVVRKVVCNSGFRLLKKSTYWGGTWGKHTKSVGFKTLFDYQKMNHFPGTFQIGRKDRLWKSMQKLMSKFGKNKFDLMPTTYILPRDKKLLKLVWKKTDGKEPWIIKPPASARGTGIKVVHKWSQIPENASLVVQKYISKPFLINDTKFDLRLYVLVTSVNPLRIYLYDNGLVRFASVKYSTELNTLSDRYMHLTNYSINKLSSKYKQNEDAHACQGHKWTLKTLWNYMETEMKVDVKKIWQRLVDLVIKTIISGEHSITQLSSANLVSRYNSYELFGIDVLFDQDLKPWLLEVNISPSLHSASPLDLAVKAPLVYDLMNIVGFHIPSSKKFTEAELCKEMGDVPNNLLCYDSRLYTGAMASGEKHKHHDFISQSRDEYIDTILEELTPDDVRHLIQYEDEITQLGSFQKIFPTSTSHEYLDYLDSPRYYNFLFDAWETKYHDNRDEGIQLLSAKCEERVHLRVTKMAGNSPKTCETHPKCRQLTESSTFVEHSTCFQNNPYLALKLKTAYLGKPRHRLRRPFVPSRTYLLRSKKPR